MEKQEADKTGGRRSDEVAQETRERILANARAVFATQGFSGVSLRDIAARAGVTHGLIRHHFGSKEAIWRAVIDDAVDEYVAELSPLLSESGQLGSTPESMLRATTRLLMRTAARHRDVARLLIHEGVTGGPRQTYFMQRIAPIRTLLRPFAVAARETGYLPQADENQLLLAVLMLGAVPFALSAFAEEVAQVRLSTEDEVNGYTDFVLALLFPPARRAERPGAESEVSNGLTD